MRLNYEFLSVPVLEPILVKFEYETLGGMLDHRPE